MKIKTIIQTILFIFFSLFVSNIYAISLTENTEIQYASVNEASSILSTRDNFIKSLSPFDRSARMKTSQSVNEEKFLNFISQQSLEWTSQEKEKINNIIQNLNNNNLLNKLNFPAKIYLIKTTGKEEGNAPYTRNADSIVFPKSKLSASQKEIERTLVHELFHILSSNNLELRDQAYSIIGFKKCNEISYPNSLLKQKITNPDAPFNEHFILVKHQNKIVPVIPVLFSKSKNYNESKGGEFFNYLVFQLMEITESNSYWSVAESDSHLNIYSVKEIRNFYEQVGKNTGYIIHPEEILADNFALLILGNKKVKSPKIISELNNILIAQ